MRSRRLGLTLVEVLIAIAILALLLGLTLSAVSRVRAEALRLRSAQRLKDIGLAVQNYAATRSGTLPGYGIVVPGAPGYGTVPPVDLGTFYPILSFLGGDNLARFNTSRQYWYVVEYQSPADPTLGDPTLTGDISYAANHQVFRSGTRLPHSLPDGLSGTVGFAERYARCNGTASFWSIGVMSCSPPDGPGIVVCSKGTMPYFERRPTFADPEYDDVLPVAAPSGAVPSVPGRTFQVRPALEACDYRVPQTPHPGGMLTAYLDGSVRTTRPGVAPAVFWAAVTPAGGEAAASLE